MISFVILIFNISKIPKYKVYQFSQAFYFFQFRNITLTTDSVADRKYYIRMVKVQGSQ